MAHIATVAFLQDMQGRYVPVEAQSQGDDLLIIHASRWQLALRLPARAQLLLKTHFADLTYLVPGIS